MNIDTLLVDKYRVSRADIEKAKAYQRKNGGRIERLLLNMGSLSEDSLPELYSDLLDIPIIDNLQTEEDWTPPSWSSELDTEFLKLHGWLPFSQEKPGLFVTHDPYNWDANQYLLSKHQDYQLALVHKKEFGAFVDNLNSATDEEELKLSDFEEDKLRELATEAPTVNLLNGLIAKGVQQKASDMHLEPVAGRYRIRYRIDGVLQDEGELPVALQLAIISRVKILANMDIAEKRRPQDGKIEIKVANTELDIRVSALPVDKGESVVMRFLRKDAVKYDMQVLGISDDLRAKISEDLKTTSGVILLTGPTGSGKTTSLYTFLNELNNDEVKIVTLEDPVEYQLEGINQVQVHSDIGFNFAAGLRSIVRQDPDIIMVGEIRDKETAQIALQSALTGHLVFSTVHTNDAPSAFTRLIDLGVEEFLLNAAIVSIIAQRLVRKVCTHCSEPAANAAELIEQYQLRELIEKYAAEEVDLRRGKGCEACGYSGYKGRMSILEYLPCSENIRALPKDSLFIPQAKKINQSSGNRTLKEDGLLKACLGQTTVEEVMRVCA